MCQAQGGTAGCSCSHNAAAAAKEQQGRLQAVEGYLQEMVLDDVPNDSELVKVAPAALGPEGLFHHDLDV